MVSSAPRVAKFVQCISSSLSGYMVFSRSAQQLPAPSDAQIPSCYTSLPSLAVLSPGRPKAFLSSGPIFWDHSVHPKGQLIKPTKVIRCFDWSALRFWVDLWGVLRSKERYKRLRSLIKCTNELSRVKIAFPFSACRPRVRRKPGRKRVIARLTVSD